MKNHENKFYVYVYIDPRNYEEFYYGKGTGNRKNAHLIDKSVSKKTDRIAAIHKAGLKPIVRVIAKDLSQEDAFLVEKTLLWKLGKQLTNISSGNYSEKFRPHDTMHQELSGFDFEHGIYYYNVGESVHRNWDDYKNHGFISGGQGVSWRDAMLGFQEGDIVAAYLKKKGFVGIGRVVEPAKPIRYVNINGVPLTNYDLVCKNMTENISDDEKCEYVALVQWLAKVDRNEAKRKSSPDIFTTPLIRASLDNQPKTIDFLEKEFGVTLRELVQ